MVSEEKPVNHTREPVLGVRMSPDRTEVAVHMPFASQSAGLTTERNGTWVAMSANVDQVNVRIVELDHIDKWTELTPS